MHFLIRLTRWIDCLNYAVGWLMRWAALAMVLIGVYNATVRYLGSYFSENLASNAYLEMQWYLFGAIFLLGGAYGLSKDVHVRVDVLFGRLSPKGKAWIDLIGILVFMLPFLTLVLWVSIPWVMASWHIHEMSPDPGGLPRAPVKTIVPVAMLLLILQGVAQAIKAFAVLRGLLPTHLPDPQQDNAL